MNYFLLALFMFHWVGCTPFLIARLDVLVFEFHYWLALVPQLSIFSWNFQPSIWAVTICFVIAASRFVKFQLFANANQYRFNFRYDLVCSFVFVADLVDLTQPYYIFGGEQENTECAMKGACENWLKFNSYAIFVWNVRSFGMFVPGSTSTSILSSLT